MSTVSRKRPEKRIDSFHVKLYDAGSRTNQGYSMKAYFLFSLFIVIAAASAACAKYSGDLVPGQWIKGLSVPASGSDGKAVQIQIYIPKDFKSGEDIRTLIMLHSYGRNMNEWKIQAVVKSADENKMIIVCPDMGKTVYENEFFPETTLAWNAIPGGKWIPTVLVLWLRSEFGFCVKRDFTGIAGVEMGARGAILAAARNPEMFSFAAGIAGLYDCTSLSSGDSFARVYGPYKANKERWENSDSILNLAPNLAHTTVFMFHGKRDKVSPAGQSHLVLIKLAQLKKKNPDQYRFRFLDKSYGDGWDIWIPAIPEMFNDFTALKSTGK